MRSAVILLFVLVGPVANATIIYSFIGVCDPIVCTGTAKGTLVLEDSYVPGTLPSSSDYVSWSLESSAGMFELNDPDLAGFNGIIAGALPERAGTADFLIDYIGDGTFFQTAKTDGFFGGSAGSWMNRGPEPFNSSTTDKLPIPMSGPMHTWIRRVPEPAIVAMMLIGLILGMGRRVATVRC